MAKDKGIVNGLSEGTIFVFKQKWQNLCDKFTDCLAKRLGK